MSEQAQSSGHEWVADVNPNKCCECGWRHTERKVASDGTTCYAQHRAHVSSVAQAAQPERFLTKHQKEVEDAAGMPLDWGMANASTVAAAQPQEVPAPDTLHKIMRIISAGETDGGEFNGDTEYAIAEIRKVLAAAQEVPAEQRETIEDGFGSSWLKRCWCGGTNQIMRPGKIQCTHQHLHESRAAQPASAAKPPEDGLRQCHAGECKDEMIWRKELATKDAEREAAVKDFKKIANLAHLAWSDKDNIRWLFERIEEIANARLAQPAPGKEDRE